jgi:polysaccharide biosynthesis/export protein
MDFPVHKSYITRQLGRKTNLSSRYRDRHCGLTQKAGALFVAIMSALLIVPTHSFGAQVSIADSSKPKSNAKPNVEPASSAKATPVDTAADASTYRIGLDDSLAISVWHEPELSSTVVVRPDGIITLPLLNDLRVVGLKPSELQVMLIQKLKPFVTEPQVTVSVQTIRSRKVSIVGQVPRQGVFPLGGDETVLELLASSGGVSPYGKANSIYILRTVNNKQVRIPFHFKSALQGRSPKDDILLQPGDIIVVP